MTTGPRPADIPFDHAAAQGAVDALTATARVLADADSARGTTSSTARADFRGGHADSFGSTDADLRTEASGATSALSTLTTAIETAMAQATTAQAEVAEAQRLWDAENAMPRPGGPMMPR